VIFSAPKLPSSIPYVSNDDTYLQTYTNIHTHTHTHIHTHKIQTTYLQTYTHTHTHTHTHIHTHKIQTNRYTKYKQTGTQTLTICSRTFSFLLFPLQSLHGHHYLPSSLRPCHCRSHIWMFCLPHGVLFREEPAEPCLFPFVVTTNDGSKLYGACVTIYQSFSSKVWTTFLDVALRRCVCCVCV
jgi:uDENN domain